MGEDGAAAAVCARVRDRVPFTNCEAFAKKVSEEAEQQCAKPIPSVEEHVPSIPWDEIKRAVCSAIAAHDDGAAAAVCASAGQSAYYNLRSRFPSMRNVPKAFRGT